MIKGIGVRGFRGFRHAELHDLTWINLVTGPPGSGKTNLLEAVHAGCCGGRMEAITREGARPVRETSQALDSKRVPYAWQSLLHREAGAAAADKAEITIRASEGDPLKTTIEHELDKTKNPVLTVLAERGAARSRQTLFWNKRHGTGGNSSVPMPGIPTAWVPTRPSRERLRGLVSRASRGTRTHICKELQRLGIEVDEILTLYDRQPVGASARIAGMDVPLETLGATAVALTAILTTSVDSSWTTLLIDELDAGSRTAARALWRALEHGVREHGIQVVAATSSMRVLEAAAGTDYMDVAVYDLGDADGNNVKRYAGAELTKRVEFGCFD